MSAEQAVAPRRPRNRKRLVLDAAGPIFAERGYHAASMEEIASAVGITAAALYRHFPNKYALFARCAEMMVGRLVDVLDALPDEAPLSDVLHAVAVVTVEHRASGGVHRWEARYLDQPDRDLLRARFGHVVDRVAGALRREYPGPEVHLRAAAALGAIGSITMHRTTIAQRRAEALLEEAALGVVRTDVSAPVAGAPEVVLPVQPVARTRRAQILAAAVPMFEQDGFTSVGLGRIAAAVGLSPSAIYRHYPGKVDILAAACVQAAGLLAQAVEQSVRGGRDPRERLVALAATYVAYSFEHRALTSVAEAEVVGLPPHLRRPVVLAQREHVAVWEEQLRAAREDLDPRQARVLVHAGLGVVVEAGRRLRWQDTPAHRGAVSAMLLGALGLTGPGRGR